jgi:hypothetical protein
MNMPKRSGNPANEIPHLPPFIREAVEEQQHCVQALSGLIECYREATESGSCSDMIAAGNGLVDIADSIVSALDEQSVAERAPVLEEEHRREREREARERAQVQS